MKELICIVCPRGCHLRVDEEHGCSVTGNSCPKGAEYGKMELTNPTRVATSTVRCVGGVYPRCPVKTDAPIPKGLIFQAVKALDGVELHAPVKVGDTVIKDVCGTGVSFVAARSIQRTEQKNKI